MLGKKETKKQGNTRAREQDKSERKQGEGLRQRTKGLEFGKGGQGGEEVTMD